jgi:hypothetical protein
MPRNGIAGNGDCMKLKNFCKAKKTVIRLKRQSIEWKKISC